MQSPRGSQLSVARLICRERKFELLRRSRHFTHLSACRSCRAHLLVAETTFTELYPRPSVYSLPATTSSTFCRERLTQTVHSIHVTWMPTVAMNSSSAQSTPNRDRTHPYRSDMSSSSPSTLRVAQPSTSSSNTAGPSATPLTVQGLLSTYASATDPRLSALEYAVSERNILSSQNAQLWKLIERQRTGYAQLVKEVERVRGEREVYRTKLQSLGENTDALLKAHREKEKREGKDPLRSASSHTHLRSSESGGSNASGSNTLEQKASFLRANSDDIGESVCFYCLIERVMLLGPLPLAFV